MGSFERSVGWSPGGGVEDAARSELYSEWSEWCGAAQAFTTCTILM